MKEVERIKSMHEDKLYAVAYACAEMQDQGCSGACVQCQYNIFNYVDDIREASLLKTNAAYDYYKKKNHDNDWIEINREEERRHRIHTLCWLAGIALVILFIVIKCKGG